MKDLFTVASFTIKDMIKRKSFIISNLIILAIIVLLFNVPNILNAIMGDNTSSQNTKILIVDEALSVGDEEFKNKCTTKVNDIINKDNVTLLFVTHSTQMAKEFCKRGIVMEKGKLKFDGSIDDAIERYEKTLKKK